MPNSQGTDHSRVNRVPARATVSRRLALFVELAARTGCPLLTFDKAVIKAFPDIAIRPRALPEG